MGHERERVEVNAVKILSSLPPLECLCFNVSLKRVSRE